MFSVIGWVAVIWLLGSVIYSSFFHIRTYRVQKKRILTGEVGEVYAKLHKEMKWGTLFTIQIIKVIVALMLIYVLTSGNDIKIFNQNGWTEKNKMAFFEGCKGNVPILGMTEEQMDSYCKLVLEKLIKAVPNPDKLEGGLLPEDLVRRIQIEALEELGLVNKGNANKANSADAKNRAAD
ncbi:MAG: hypothetical protein JRF46_17380 [Deltaproteobacteria bacterium]|nr:hypothetical protein [Deltaproteobacteria bacterium]